MAGGRQNEKRLKILKEILKVQFDLIANELTGPGE